MSNGKSLQELRFEEYIQRLQEEKFSQAYIRFYQLYAKYYSGRSPNRQNLSPDEQQELQAFLTRRGQLQIPDGFAEGLYEKIWTDYERYVQENSPRISQAKYLDMIGSQYGLTAMATAQMTDVDIVGTIAREILFREMLKKEA